DELKVVMKDVDDLLGDLPPDKMDLRPVKEVRTIREEPRTPGAVTSMGLREKARKSLQGGEREEAEELEAPVMPKVDIGKIEAEAKAREDQLRRELADSRKLSDAKG